MVDCDSGVGARGNADCGAEGVGDFIGAGVEMDGCHSRVGIWRQTLRNAAIDDDG